MSHFSRVLLLGLLGLAGGCSEDPGRVADADDFTPAEWKKLRTLGPLGLPPPDPTNRFADDDRAAALGQRIFFEASYSGPLTVGDDGENGSLGSVGDKGKVACASCHQPESWFIDHRSNPNATSLGAAWTPRNSPSLVNVAFYSWFGWGGKQDSLWMQGATSHESKDNTAGNRLQYVHIIFNKYRQDYNAIFPVPLDPALDALAADASRFPASSKPKSSPSDPDGPWERMAEADRVLVNTIISNLGKALQAYERRLISGNSPLDRYISGDSGALSPAAKRGLRLFIGKAACITCHAGIGFSDNSFYNTGVPQALGQHVPESDNGRYDDLPKVLTGTFNGASRYSDAPAIGMEKLSAHALTEPLRGCFRTKSLRNAAVTGPYLHNGSLRTLAEVVHFYNLGGGQSGYAGTKDARMVPLNLGSGDEADLVEFLKALTGEPVPAALTVDTSAR
jgi:cytochrome c peroxidase